MSNELPDLSSEHEDQVHKSWFGGVDSPTLRKIVQFNLPPLPKDTSLNKKGLQITPRNEDGNVDSTTTLNTKGISYSNPLDDGSQIDLEARYNGSLSARYQTSMFDGKLSLEAKRGQDGDSSVGLQFSKQW